MLLPFASCSGDDTSLLVDLFTDLSPGQEFMQIRTQVSSQPISQGVDITEETRGVLATDDYSGATRIASFADAAAGATHVRVALLNATGSVAVQRDFSFNLEGVFSLLAVLTRDCRGVDCPGPLNGPEQTTCIAGRCAAPTCGPQNPSACPPGCTESSECPSTPDCADPLCIEGQCLAAAFNNRCDEGYFCSVELGCIPSVTVPDGGVCAETETSCDDGVDNDCDGVQDCADPECLGLGCSDNSACTTGDVCTGAGLCAGEPMVCADDNACTSDSCDPTAGCQFVNNTASCDNGSVCDGPDVCADGVCRAIDPAVCECSIDSECGAPSSTTEGACEGFANVCSTAGTQPTRTVTPRCSAGTCTEEVTNSTTACSRVTNGVSCGSVSVSWAGCAYPACATTALESGTRTTPVCRSGACNNETAPTSRGCSRASQNGRACPGSAFHLCCGVTCVDTRNNANHCGGCGVSCASQGRNCVAQGGGYTCDCANSSAQCRSIYTSTATCWTALAPDQCQCQCPADGVCPGAGCGAGSFCHDCPGGNFCSPVGGDC